MVESNFLSTKVELFLAARDIENRDTFSKSDPFCVVSLQSASSNQYNEVGRTEVKKNHLNPNWRTSVKLDYFFETKQSLRFNIWDYDDTSPDTLGEAFATLGELVGKGTSFLKISRGGTLIIRVEEIKTSRNSFVFQLRGIKLDKKDTFGKSDPYLIFYKSISNNQWAEVHKTEIIKETLNPIWKPFELEEQQLCNCDRNKQIKVECYDWDRVGAHDLIGVFETTIEPLVTRGTVFQLKNKNKNSGQIEVTEAVLKKHLSFIDYLRVGVQISLSVAIDFTGSNLDYSNPHSLHNMNIPGGNQYEKAIWEVGSILEAYDYDKFFPVFGFGGVPAGAHGVSHCFPLTKDMNNPYVQGTQGILDIYRTALRQVSLSGPTLFHHIIDATAAVAAANPPHAVYNILLILTDGAIMDMPETIRSICNAANLPMSIVIVGVGNAEFDSMEALDCDKAALVDDRGNKACRDIVQFVPFRQFGGNPVALAAEILKEIPNQLTGFMKMIGYAPPLPDEVPIKELSAPSAPVLHE